jgi:hypothetical protein
MIYAAVFAISARSRAWDLVPGLLQHLLRDHFKRTIMSILAAIPGIAVGAWLLHFEVGQHDISSQVAPVINWPLMTLLAFASNILLPFRDTEMPLKQALMRWTAMSAAHTGVTYSAYTLLVHVAGLQYLIVSLGLTFIVGPAFYVVRVIWVFATGKNVESTPRV